MHCDDMVIVSDSHHVIRTTQPTSTKCWRSLPHEHYMDLEGSPRGEAASNLSVPDRTKGNRLDDFQARSFPAGPYLIFSKSHIKNQNEGSIDTKRKSYRESMSKIFHPGHLAEKTWRNMAKSYGQDTSTWGINHLTVITYNSSTIVYLHVSYTLNYLDLLKSKVKVSICE